MNTESMFQENPNQRFRDHVLLVEKAITKNYRDKKQKEISNQKRKTPRKVNNYAGNSLM